MKTVICRIYIVIVVAAAGIVLISAPALSRDRTDTVLLVNGDHVTGEIKVLARGQVKIKTNSMSTVYIEWEDVVRLKSTYYFEIEDEDGFKYYGTPELADNDEFRITRLDAIVSLEKQHVIRMTPIEKTVSERFHGSLILGLSYTKASEVGRLDLSFNINYREEKNYLDFRLTTNLTAERDTLSSQRAEAVATYQRLFRKKLYSDNRLSAFRNDELGIALRVTLGTGIGANVIQTNKSLLESTLGLSINREWPIDTTAPVTTNVEGVLSVGYSVFKYNTPKTDLSSTVGVFPRLPSFDRWRLDVEVSLSQEIIKDFTMVFTFYNNYNSEPPSEDASENDWGFTTSVGYVF